jgi:hypothetical protein
MQRFRFWGMLLLVPVMAFVFTTGGCGGKGKEERKRRHVEVDDDEKDDEGKNGKPGGGDDTGDGKAWLATTGWGTLKGQVTLEGEVPTLPGNKAAMEAHKDKLRCLMGPSNDQTWMVQTKGGKKLVQNVVIWLDAGKGKCFKPDKAKAPWPELVKLDQPYCAFEPHIQATFAEYYDADAKKMVKSGQAFKVFNSAPIAHNTSWAGDPRKNAGGNPQLQSMTNITLDLKADTNTPITVSCTAHQWMRGKIWALDNPYIAITDKDGNYEIKNAPAGAEITVIAWHESKGKIEKKVKLEDGKTTELNFSITP